MRWKSAANARQGILQEPGPEIVNRAARNARRSPPAVPTIPAAPAALAVGPPEPTSPPHTLRLVYLDRDRGALCVERLAATSHGAKALEMQTLRPGDHVEKGNLAFLLERIAAKERSSEAVDLCRGAGLKPAGEELHPGQVLLLRGRVASTTDVLPASLLLSMTGGAIRVLVDREHGLHLNQRYLTEHEVRVIGILHSVPRTQLRAVALFTADPQSSPPSSFSTDGESNESAVS